MNKLSHSTLLLTCLSIVLLIGAACTRPPRLCRRRPRRPTRSPTSSGNGRASPINRPEKRPRCHPQVYTITFRDDGTLNGQADCNTFTGTYSQEGGFFITLGATTMAACGEDSLDQQYLQLLGSIVAGGPDGAGGFALETAGGEQRMEFANGGAAPAP